MTISVEALLVASIMMAVFAAVSTVGSSLYLGAGYERLRAGYEMIRKQTAFFSNTIHNLDKRVDVIEKQGSYFFKAITDLEDGIKISVIQDVKTAEQQSLIVTKKEDILSGTGENLLNKMNFTMLGKEESLPEDSIDSLQGDLWVSVDSTDEIHFH